MYTIKLIKSKAKAVFLVKSILLSSILTPLLPGLSLAQTIPPAADPGKTFRSYETPATPQPEPAAPAIIRDETTQRPVNKASAKQIFTLGNVEIVGMTAYAPESFDSLYSDKIGTSVSVADIEAMAATIQQRYRADGYILAQAFVPTQTVAADGVITIRIYEGQVAHITFEGDKPDDLLYKLPQEYADKIRQAHPLNASDLERYLLLINDIPGYQAQAIIRATPNEPGNSDIIILLNQKQVDALETTDNRGSRYLGPWEHQAQVTFNNVMGLDERTTIRAITTSPTTEMHFLDAIQEYKLSSEGTTLKLEALYDRTQPGEAVNSSLGIRGLAEMFSATLTQPFLRSRLENFNGFVTFDANNTSAEIFQSQKLNDDRVRSFRVGSEYDIADDWKGVNVISPVISHGVQGFGASDEDGPFRTRENASQDYTKVNLDINRTQALPYNFSFYTAGTGQYSFSRLLSSEQFLLGGPLFGTAYDPGELSGDDGVAGKAELRYGDTLGYQYFNSYQLYAYYDIGAVWLKTPSYTEDTRETLASTGFGGRFYFTPNLSGNLELSFPLNNPPPGYYNSGTRVFAGVTVRY